MPAPVISVENLSKRYLIGHRTERGGAYNYTALRDVLGQEMRNFGRKALDVFRGRQVVQGDTVEEYWALKDVSFEVQPGEVLGIIGRNGAGKSTLLKILSRITEPTSGCVTLRGRIASLLEVGTGFHPELSGRENIYLNGAILGMSRAEIRKKFDEIVAFAEVEQFLDTPVKRYSSGMYVRLAFAVAAHLEPEILIVDEVLAVGDVEFQKKCLGKMDEVSRGEGRTVLFVSHNMGAIATLCPTAIWLDQGSTRERGAARQIVSEFLSRGAHRKRIIRLADLPRAHTVNDDRLRVESLEWLSELPLRHGDPVHARIRFKTRAPVSAVTVGIGFANFDGTRLLSYETDFQDGFRPDLSDPGNYVVDVTVDDLPLAPDMYNLDVGCRSGDVQGLDYLPGCSQVEVISGSATPGYIARKCPFLDDDDLRLPNSLDVQAEILARDEKIGFVYGQVHIGDSVTCSPTGEIRPVHCPTGDIFCDLLKGNFIYVPSVLVRKSRFEALGLFTDEVPGTEDWDAWLRLAAISRVGVVQAPVGIYREASRDSGQMSRNRPRMCKSSARTLARALRLPRTLSIDTATRHQTQLEFLNNLWDDLMKEANKSLSEHRVCYALENYITAIRLVPRRAMRIEAIKDLTRLIFSGSR